MKLDFTLSFADGQWVCYDDDTQLSADTLHELESKIEDYLLQKYMFGDFKVMLCFDFDHFPHWHRQYMPHYFNSELNFSLGDHSKK